MEANARAHGPIRGTLSGSRIEVRGAWTPLLVRMEQPGLAQAEAAPRKIHTQFEKIRRRLSYFISAQAWISP
jgi:hypothetical protein